MQIRRRTFPFASPRLVAPSRDSNDSIDVPRNRTKIAAAKSKTVAAAHKFVSVNDEEFGGLGRGDLIARENRFGGLEPRPVACFTTAEPPVLTQLAEIDNLRCLRLTPRQNSPLICSEHPNRFPVSLSSASSRYKVKLISLVYEERLSQNNGLARSSAIGDSADKTCSVIFCRLLPKQTNTCKSEKKRVEEGKVLM